MKKNNTTDLLKSLFFLLYFVILTAERIVSLVQHMSRFNDFTAQDTIFAAFAIASLICGWGYLLKNGRSIFKLNAPKSGEDFIQPSIAAGILLVSGMVHTYGTIAPVQFVSYGFLLAAMGIYTGECVKSKGEPLLRWLTFAYITAFSMSIPVMYETDCDCGLCTAFKITQIIVTLGLIVCFILMLCRFFKNGSVLSFCVYVILFAAIGDGLVLFLRWHTEINYFVLAAIIITVILGAAGIIISRKKHSADKK